MIDIRDHGGVYGDKSKYDKVINAYLQMSHNYNTIDWSDLNNYYWSNTIAYKYDKNGNLLKTSFDTSQLGLSYIKNVVNDKIYFSPYQIVYVYDFSGNLLNQITTATFTMNGNFPFLDVKDNIVKVFMYENTGKLHYREYDIFGTMLLDLLITDPNIQSYGNIFETIAGNILYKPNSNYPVFTNRTSISAVTSKFKLSGLLVGGKC